jgi:hypothetical protein
VLLQWIFIIEGLLTIVVSIGAFYFISNYPDKSHFLNDNERAFIQQRLTIDRDLTTSEGFTWANVAGALTDYKVWLYALAYHSMSLPLYTLSLFLPTIITNLGYTAAAAQVILSPTNLLKPILTVLQVAYNPSIRARHMPHSRHRHALRAKAAPRSIHHGIFSRRYHRLLYPPRQHCSPQEQGWDSGIHETWHLVRGNVLLRCRHLPRCSARTELARRKCEWCDEEGRGRWIADYK